MRSKHTEMNPIGVSEKGMFQVYKFAPQPLSTKPWMLEPECHQLPDVAWKRLKVAKGRVVRTVAPVLSSAQPPDTLRLVCISDTHGRIDETTTLPSGDVLVHCGDFSNIGSPTDIEKFARFLEAQPHRHKVVIAGNHDLTFHKDSFAMTRKSIWGSAMCDATIDCAKLKARVASVCTYLEDSSVTIEGVNFYGSPWTPTFYNWAFNSDRGSDIAQRHARIPTETDVLLVHGPPIGYGDACRNGLRAGCVDLLKEIETRVKPFATIYGHIHESYGVTTNGETLFINASTCTMQYNPTNAAIVVDVPTPTAPPK
eukprot:m.29398 g.29398  ORF g.29398 m.29398 type:complete len:312 (+) comp13710_c0_seq1:242-1177(+)